MKRNAHRFQLSLDTDSVFISQVPNASKSRIVLTALEHSQLQKIVKSIVDADLKEEFIEMLEKSDH